MTLTKSGIVAMSPKEKAEKVVKARTRKGKAKERGRSYLISGGDSTEVEMITQA